MKLIPLNKSLSVKLLKAVFSIYIVLTMVVTGIQIGVDYSQAKTRIKDDLQFIGKTIEDGLSNAVWDINDQLIDDIVNGLLGWPVVVGVEVLDEKGRAIKALGEFASNNDSNELFWETMPLVKQTSKGEAQSIGTLKLYSTAAIAFDEVKLGILVLLINAIIKSIALWLIFMWIFRRMLTEPLQKFSNEARNLDLDNVKERFIQPVGKNDDEIDILRNSFNEMVNKLSATHRQLKVAVDALNEKASSASSLLSATLDSTTDGILVVSLEKQISAHNQQFLSLFDIAPEIVNADNSTTLFDQLFTKINKSGEFREKVNLLDTQTTKAQFLVLKLKDGRTLECYSQPQRFGGVITGRVWSFRDITKQIELDKLKDEFISSVNHELRTPLTSIHGSLGLISAGVMGELPEKAKTMINTALSNSERLILIVNDILDMEKILAGKMQYHLKPMQLMIGVRKAVEANRAYGEKFNVSFEILNSIEDAVIEVDFDRLMQVLTNLLSNAVKFSPKGSKVEISLSRNLDRIRIAVTDHGPGIPLEYQNLIFQKFSQITMPGHAKTAGTGLGLSISKSIVEDMGGVIGFTSDPGIGTTFFIEFQEYRSNASSKQAS